jgi:histidyl-tRNA synthetase
MKPSLPDGTRDFSPEQIAKRTFIFDTIKSIFVRYGFQPIETPAMEKLATLTGKYGEEGDKLLFKILNNGLSRPEKHDSARAALEKVLQGKSTDDLTERALRYDLTVPFARYVVMHQNDIEFPFKRYQIQPVWRGDRPARGRYREFYQCDVDVVGSNSLMYEAELVKIYDSVFAALGFGVTIKINNRKVLFGIAEAAGVPEKFVDMTVVIDKLDKIGIDGVKKELSERGFSSENIEKIQAILQETTLEGLQPHFANSATGMKGIEELKTVFTYLQHTTLTNVLQFDITLARGLNYYTGCIIEVAANGVLMGSIGGGGRYDDLTGNFGLKGVSGVGISFGAERIYDVMQELKLFPENITQSLQVLLIAFDADTHKKAFDYVQQIRNAGINAELYPDPLALKKQMKYANARAVPYVLLIGSTEVESGLLSLKNMVTGEQEKLAIEAVIGKFLG